MLMSNISGSDQFKWTPFLAFYAAGQTYFPEGVARPGWYQPTDRGVERRLGERLAWLRSLDDETPPEADA